MHFQDASNALDVGDLSPDAQRALQLSHVRIKVFRREPVKGARRLPAAALVVIMKPELRSQWFESGQRFGDRIPGPAMQHEHRAALPLAEVVKPDVRLDGPEAIAVLLRWRVKRPAQVRSD